MSRPIITLTTDFGAGSPYVAQMKGAILSINPDANIIDISHTVPPQDIRQGAIVLKDVCDIFPPETIHVAVVDPGVGTDRKIVWMKIGNQMFVAPDNGLLSQVAKKTQPTMTLEVTNANYWRDDVSPTFHGRDIMAPVAAHLSLGVEPREIGKPVESVVRLSIPEVLADDCEIRGSIVSFDSFGNLITDITSAMLKQPRRSDRLRIECGNHVVEKLVHTYGAEMDRTLIALQGSSGMLELAIVSGNAAQTLGVEVGDLVIVKW